MTLAGVLVVPVVELGLDATGKIDVAFLCAVIWAGLVARGKHSTT